MPQYSGKILKILLISLVVTLAVIWQMQKKRPNIVLIIIDTLRADKLGCYGFFKNVSPEIDSIADRGVVFENVISQCSWTKPSAGSMLTSRYPRSLGLYKRDNILQNRYTTFAEILQADGYETFGITANPHMNSVFNFAQGFDKYIDSDVLWDWMKPEKHKKNRNMDLGALPPFPTSEKIFSTCLKAAKSMRKKTGYIQINIMEVHEGLTQVRPEFKNVLTEYENSWYLAPIRQVSKDIGAFINALQKIQGWRNTMFIITSDHGQAMPNDHVDVITPGTPHGDLLYESQVKVPMVLYHTGLEPKKIKQPVRLIDLMPTILDYINVSLPKDINGKSLLALIKGGGVKLPKYFVTETNWRKKDKLAVYGNKWKYIENLDGQKNTNKYELQAMGLNENGIKTDKIKNNSGAAVVMKEFLRSWEKSFPKMSGKKLDKIPENTTRQLRTLGYLN